MSAPAPSSLLFVLGIQRSGTTWIGNIFDASPDTLLFMEPFAPACGRFPDFPETGYFLNTAPPTITRLLTETMYRRLYRRKFLFSHRSLQSPRYFRFERGIARMAERISKFAPRQLQRRILQFSQLNLNRLDPGYPIYRKPDTLRHCVIKELRFAGKIPLPQAAFPKPGSSDSAPCAR